MGAVAAHALHDILPPDKIDTITKAAQYQMYHSIVLLALAFNASAFSRTIKTAAVFFCTGIILFSGSLYGHVFTQIHAFVYITPLG